jgi:hypothetical protein
MPCLIASNNILSPEIQKAVSKAVRNGISERLGGWNVAIYQAPDYPAFAIKIEGPKGLRWSWTFFEQEQTSEFIEERVAKGIMAQLLLHEESTSSNNTGRSLVSRRLSGLLSIAQTISFRLAQSEKECVLPPSSENARRRDESYEEAYLYPN